MTLLGPNGQPIQPVHNFKKADAPALGPAYGQWAGRDTTWAQMPGGSVLYFDTSQLTLADFRAMRDHPQINASLSALTFMLHQIEWHVECEDKKIEAMVGANLDAIWTRLIRGFSQSFWAGFSPCVLEYENNVSDRTIEISKIKDLVPEECEVNWKIVEGSVASPSSGYRPKFTTYDGIKQMGFNPTIPAENTVWYPLLMENGNYYGRKLLKSAFMPWYFSILMHLFSNRYFERFGEPLPVGRAPFDDTVPDGNGGSRSGKQAMEDILMNLRNRSVVVLPSDIEPGSSRGSTGRPTYSYDIEYLESQMRGADFERYMTRLDEEMSLSIFTPLLLLRNGDVGSANLGVQHTQTWLWMLNALTGDMKEYIDRYITQRLKALNFSPNAPDCRWVPRKLGKESVETTRAVVTELIRQGKASVDLGELGEALGMTVTEVKQVTAPPADPTDPTDPPPDATQTDARNRTERSRGNVPRGVGEPRATGRLISNRIKGQVERAFRENRFGTGFEPSLGFRRRFIESLEAEGCDQASAEQKTEQFFGRLTSKLNVAIDLGTEEWSGPSDFMAHFDRILDSEINRLGED